MEGKKIRENSGPAILYKLDINLLRSQLKNVQEFGKNSKPVVISIPTLDGMVEKFAVYSFPVVVKELADQYQLGSYSGVGINDPLKQIRFSLAPNDFQSMIIKNGEYQFIDPINTSKTVYGVHKKTVNTGNRGFLCSMNENQLSKQQIENLYEQGKTFTNNPLDFSKSSDKKYRTLRLAMSVTAEYTTYFGGVAGALTAINATLTRCNGVFEKDFALHLNLQNYPALIYTNASTDPYSPSATGSGGAWNTELQSTLTSVVGNANYDIGHLFGDSGGGGNAGCIGCICVNPTAAVPEGKGSGYTSPADGIPQGDNFDIDYVAHELGHQFGANHTFAHSLEGTGVNVEPGSGSTIMGYAGITGSSTDIQAHSDPYFHKVSIGQVQANLISKTCDVETAITNNPPVIAALPAYTIPKGTAFVLTASATDPENDPITYCWEEIDDASVTINKTNIGTTTSGGSFRSFNPVTSPTRYFPKFSSVMAGTLNNALNTWESVSTVARTSNFAVTVRDNNANAAEQQTQFATQAITVGSAGPFIVTSTSGYNNSASAVTWNVVTTTAAPYNVANVKIDYTTDNGATWVVLSASTPNDGTENFTFTGVTAGSTVKVRVSAIGNVFYAVGPMTITTIATCSSAAPTNVVVSAITQTQANVTWGASTGATYEVRYRVVGSTTWTTVNVATNSYLITGLTESTQYEVQVANVCSGVTGTFSASTLFTTLGMTYCPIASTNTGDEYISQVKVTPTGGPAVMTSDSGASFYTDYTTDPTRLVTLVLGSTGNALSVTKFWTSTQWNETVTVWIDFNRNGVFEDATEKVVSTPGNTVNPATGTFTVPTTAYGGPLPTRMRVIMKYSSAPTNACTGFTYGEIEDYAVKFTGSVPCAATIPTGLVVSNISSTTATATWTANTTNGATYSLQYRPVGSTTWTTVPLTTNTYNFTGLTTCTPYEIQVASVCGTVIGTYSTPVNFTTCCNNTPTGITVTNITSTTAVANWTAVPNGATYSFQYRVLGAATWTTLNLTTNTYNFAGLTTCTTYEFRVATVCGTSIGTYSTPTVFTTCCTNPPTNVTVTTITPTSATVNWTPSSSNTTYVVQYRPLGSTTWTTVPVTGTSYNIIGLNASTQYQVQVAATCSTVTGTYTTPVVFTTLCNTNPPTNVTVTNITSYTADVSWNAILGVTYIVRYRITGTTTWTTVPAATNNITLTGLAAYAQYEVQVATVCLGVTGAFTNSVIFTTKADCLTPPLGLSVTGITNSQALVSWDAFTGATYVVRYRKIGANSWTVVNSATNSYLLTNLLDYTTYEVQVLNVCSGTPSTNYTQSYIFITLPVKVYCTMGSQTPGPEFISNVEITPIGTGLTTMTSASGSSSYSNYTADANRLITLYQASLNNKISVSKGWQSTHYDEAIKVWIDFNRDGLFESTEVILNSPANQTTPIEGTFNVPTTAFLSMNDTKLLVMRVALSRDTTPVTCVDFVNGEVEDYAVKILPINTPIVGLPGIQIFPNPTSDLLNFTKVKPGAGYKIYNEAGRLVMSGVIAESSISVKHLLDGVYIIAIDNYGETKQIKFIKDTE